MKLQESNLYGFGAEDGSRGKRAAPGDSGPGSSSATLKEILHDKM